MTDNFHWRVLIVDDEPDIREVLSLTLTDAGYQVQTAADGQLAIAAYEAFAPHIVISDIRMPQMDGLQLLEYSKSKYPDVEVVVATAFAEMASAIKALQLDASDFVTKPINNDALMVALDRARHRYQTRQKLRNYMRFIEKEWTDTTRELMESFTYQRKLIESSMDGIIGCNENDAVVTFNQRMAQISEYQKEAVVHHMRWQDFFKTATAERLQFDLIGKDFGGPGHLYVYETMLLTRSGTDIPVQISATQIEEKDRVEGLVFFIRDLRQIRRLEQQMAHQAHILHQDKMMSIGRLAASVAHEINNPLSGIFNYLKLMQRILNRTPTQKELEKFSRYLQTAAQETERCAQIVSNLLTFSRKSKNENAPVKVKELLERSMILSRHRLELSNIAFEMTIAPDAMVIQGDINQLQQCIINLIFNAIDAMPTGGQLILSAKPTGKGRHILISVKDNGCGITPENRERIFEPFFTTKSEGAGVGLGLSTTYGIIDHHGGTIHLESQPGKGSTFIIQLPALA